MEKDAAAIDTVEFTDNFICRSSITRSDMLFITFGSSIFAKELPSCVSTGDQALFTQRGSSIILCLPYGFWWSLSRISATQLKHEMAACLIRLFLRDWEIWGKIIIFYSKTCNFNIKNELNACIFIVLFSNLCSEAFKKALKSAFFHSMRCWKVGCVVY